MRIALLSLPLLLIVACAPRQQPAALTAGVVRADPVEASPDVYSVRLENEHVRVLEMRLAPGARDAWHSHPAEVVRFTRAGQARVHLPDGTAVDKRIEAGEVMWSDAWTHRVENTGAQEIHAVIVELKQGAAPPEAPPGADPAVVSDDHYGVALENDRVRVLDMRLPAGERDEMHVHPGYVAYFVSGADLRFAFPDGRTGGREIPQGEVLWSPPLDHQVQNAGRETAHVWIVELKSR